MRFALEDVRRAGGVIRRDVGDAMVAQVCLEGKLVMIVALGHGSQRIGR